VLLNPTVIIEVLSPNTESDDRGKKFQRYREIDTLRDYVLIAQDEARIERFARQESGLWQLSEATGLAAEVALPSIGCVLRLAEVYEVVEWH